MRILQTNFYGDPNLGLFAKTSDKVCLISKLTEKLERKIEDVLKVKILNVSIAKTDLVGIFCCLNSFGILLPKIVSNSEIERFKRISKELGINLGILKSKFTAIGNLVLCNDNGVIISKNFSKIDKKIIENCLGAECEYSTIAGMSVIGSSGIATNKGCLVHRDTREEEIKTIEEVLKVPVDIGTANFGSPFVGSCVFANSNGAIVGENTTGPEVTRLMEVLQLI